MTNNSSGQSIIDNAEKGVWGLCPTAMNDPKGCPYGFPSRANCTHCQDLPIWYFDKSKRVLDALMKCAVPYDCSSTTRTDEK